MNLGDANLRVVNTSRPALVHSISKQSVTASDDFYSLSSGESSQDEKSTVRRYDTPPLYTIPEPCRRKEGTDLKQPTVRAVTRTPPIVPQTGPSRGSQQLHKVKRKPLSTESSPTYSNNEVISPPTPGVDDTPYIQFAIEQLTRDEEVNEAFSSHPYGAPSRLSHPVERVIPDEQFRLQQGLQSGDGGKAPLEPIHQFSDSSINALPATPTQDFFRYPTLDYLPKCLRLRSLIALILCCILMVAAIIFSNSRYFTVDDEEGWKWTTCQPVGWILLALYLLLILALVLLVVKLRRDPSGLRWDPRSLADILVLFQRSNVLSDLYGSEVRAGSSCPALAKKYTLRYWIAGKRSTEIFHGIEESQAPLRGFRHQRTASEQRQSSGGIQAAPYDLEGQRPLKASTLDSLQKDVHSPRIRYQWLPWFLKDTFVVAWIVIAVVLMLAFVIVSFVNNAVRRGFIPRLPSASTSQGFSPADFLYSFIPSFIGMILFLLWQSIDMYFRALQPFVSLGGSTRGSPADESILLDYTACLPVEVTIKAALAGHYKVAWISFISLLSATLPVLSGGVFTAQYFIPSREVRVAASMPGYYGQVVFIIIYSLSFLMIWPTKKRRLPHDIRTLGQILSFVYESQLLNDSAFWQPRSKVDLVTRLLGRLTGDKGSSRYAFGVYMGRDGREHLGIDRLSRPESGEMFITTGLME
ncbi:MAG: hypothetical protein L6R35_001807 [Caloplaca aegaea]|nr:MAG: hypothetical protein L6R35_001807 [Caloplaca aegaea]